jgi:hypothetical protein
LNPITVFRIINLLFAGILAGMEIAIHYGLHAPIKVLSDQSQLQLRQALVRRLRVLVPAFFLPAALSGDRRSGSRWHCSRLLVSLRGNSGSARLGPDQGHRHGSDQRRHGGLGHGRAAGKREKLKSITQSAFIFWGSGRLSPRSHAF